MRTQLAGFLISFEEATLSPTERGLLATFPTSDDARADFHVVVRRDGVPGGPRHPHPQEAEVIEDAEHVRIIHPAFHGSVHLASRSGTLYSSGADAYPLHVFLRLVTNLMISVSGDLPFHAAALLFDRQAVIFFGRSGAGKSTVARALGRAALSDELIRVSGNSALASGFWGSLELERRSTITEAFPIRAAVGILQGSPASLTPLQVGEAIPLLLSVCLVPRVGALWQEALPRVIAFAETVPIYTMQWRLGQHDPARVLEPLLR